MSTRNWEDKQRKKAARQALKDGDEKVAAHLRSMFGVDLEAATVAAWRSKFDMTSSTDTVVSGGVAVAEMSVEKLNSEITDPFSDPSELSATEPRTPETPVFSDAPDAMLSDRPPPPADWPFGAPLEDVQARGGKYKYVNPVTGGKSPSVTTVLGIINKPALTAYAVKQVAEEAVANPYNPDVETADMAVDRFKKARWGVTSRGTEAHAAMENRVLPEECRDEDLANMVSAGYKAMNMLGLRPAIHEARVWGDGYAGSVDVIAVNEEGETIAVEFKSTSKEDPIIFNDSILQASAYANGDLLADETGRVFEIPDGLQRAIVITISPSGKWRSADVAGDLLDEAFSTFCKWKEMGKTHAAWEEMDFNSGNVADSG